MGRNFYLINHTKEIIYDLGSAYSLGSEIRLTEMFNFFKWDLTDEIVMMDDQSYKFDSINGYYCRVDSKGNITKPENEEDI